MPPITLASTTLASSADRLDSLRRTIQAIERKSTLPVATATPHAAGEGWPVGESWRIGAPDVDARIGGALETGAAHEIKPVAGSRTMAAAASARCFAMGLVVRHLSSTYLSAVSGTCGKAPVLWCTSSAGVAEYGRPYGPGLAALGLDPSRLLLVETAKAADVLWAIEEGLKSGAPALVVGETGEIGLTPSRRLALAAAGTNTPCLLLTPARSAPTPATSTRWRIAPAPSPPDPFDPQAPGYARCLVTLERCRLRPAAETTAMMLEWRDDAFHVRVVAGLADRASPARSATGGHTAALARRRSA